MPSASSRFYSKAQSFLKAIDRAPMFAIVSFALLVLVTAFWIAGHRRNIVLGVRNGAGHLQAVGSDRWGMVLFFSDIPFGREMRWTADEVSVHGTDFRAIHDWVFDPSFVKRKGLGFAYALGNWNLNVNTSCRFEAVFLPYWALIGALAALPARIARRIYLRRQWRRAGRCLHCGYDLRHSLYRCPECGASRAGRFGNSAGGGGGIAIACIIIVLLAAASLWVEQSSDPEVIAETAVERAAGFDRRVPELIADDVPLTQVLDQLAKAVGLRIVKSPTAATRTAMGNHSLLKSGKAWNTTICMHLRDVSVAGALTVLCHQASDQFFMPLTFAAREDGSIFVSVDDEMPYFVRVHDVRSILKVQGGDPDINTLTQEDDPYPPTWRLGLLFGEQGIWEHTDARESSPWPLSVGGRILMIGPRDLQVKNYHLYSVLRSVKKPWPDSKSSPLHGLSDFEYWKVRLGR